MIKLMDDSQTIRVQLWTNGAWKHNIRGQVIGSHDGIVGVLLDNGEYVDVPEERLRIIGREGRRPWTNRKRLKA